MIDFKRRALAVCILMGASLANAASVAITPGSNGNNDRRQYPELVGNPGHSNGIGSSMSASGKKSVAAFENKPVEVSASEVDEVPVPGTLGLFAIGAIALVVLRRRIND